MCSLREDEKLTLKELVDTFVEQNNEIKEDSKLQSFKVQEALKQYIYNEIKEQIIDEEIENIKVKAHNRQKEEEKNEKFRRMKILIFETLVVGFISGLLINQITELIALWKGEDHKEVFTWFWTLGLFMMLLLLIIGMYLNKIDEFFNGKE